MVGKTASEIGQVGDRKVRYQMANLVVLREQTPAVGVAREWPQQGLFVSKVGVEFILPKPSELLGDRVAPHEPTREHKSDIVITREGLEGWMSLHSPP